MTTYPTNDELEQVVLQTGAPNPLDSALKTLLKSSKNAMSYRASPFVDAVQADEKVVEAVNTYLYENVKRVIMQRSSEQFAAWHGAELTAPDIFKGFQFIVMTRGSLVYGVPESVVPQFKFQFTDTWVSVADDLWYRHVKKAYPTTCTADKGNCKDWMESLWGSLVGAAKERKHRERSTTTGPAAKFLKIEQQQQEGFKSLMEQLKTLIPGPPIVAPAPPPPREERLIVLRPDQQLLNGKIVEKNKKKNKP